MALQNSHWTAAEAHAAIAGGSPVSLEELCPPGAILVVAPHPDDETLGCGGLIATAVEAGRSVSVAILTDGSASHPGSRRAPPSILAQIRRREVCTALRRLGADGVVVSMFDAPDGHLRDHRTAAEYWLRQIMSGNDFRSIFTTWCADPHPDHKAAFAIAQTAANAADCALCAYPVWGLTLEPDADAGPRRRCVGLNVSAVLERKERAIMSHRSQTSALIPDAPDAFRLSQEDMARHLLPLEPYLLVGREG